LNEMSLIMWLHAASVLLVGVGLWMKIRAVERNHFHSIDVRFDRVESRIDKIGERIARIEGKLET